jgi:hypothetical protein
MSSIHYCAAWTECDCLVSCGHFHDGVGEAVTCIPMAGAYVVAIDANVMRALNVTEEGEVQGTIHISTSDSPAVDTPAIAACTAIDSRYAVMTRIKAGDHWRWTTWMCFGTYAEASAHAREGDKVVRFRSAEWQELRRQRAVVPPGHVCAGAHLLPQFEDETLVEFVFRMFSTFELEKKPDPGSKIQRESIFSEGIQDRERRKRKRA